MNADMLSKLVAALTPDSALRKAFLAPPLLDTLPAGPRGQHVRAGYTKNHNRPRNKARAKMAQASRRRNRTT